jgi:hypothetical protein
MATQQHINRLNQLFLRADELLGTETMDAVLRSPARKSAFCTAMSAAIKENKNDPLKVSNIQIEGALEIALEIWPFEAEAVANANYKGDAS